MRLKEPHQSSLIHEPYLDLHLKKATEKKKTDETIEEI
jgi:hypothetical protein